MRLFHFSHRSDIAVFKPHLSATANSDEPLVWAIDEVHAPSYWFPRDCPRACCWQGAAPLTAAGAALLGLGGARRLHAIEDVWLDRMRECELYAYEFDPAPFTPKLPEAGYWVTAQEVRPLGVTPVGSLLARHTEARIGLRIVNNLWPLIDAIVVSGLEFSIIRKANAQPRVPRADGEGT